ncbi:MAG TPA: hypothetical protein ENN99_13660 [Chloroflexi bacterium]|nr:hypothetical protein [Chloroflexota bacterium]
MSFQWGFVRALTTVVVVAVLLVAWGGQAQADGVSSHLAKPAESADEAALACLALVGGAALLAVGMFADRIRCLLS